MLLILKKAGRLLIVLYLLIQCCAASVLAQSGTEFFVAVDGSDSSGVGSSVNPWATIEHALGQVPDSSSVIVRSGTYLGRIRLNRVFTNGVTVRAEQSYQARLRHNSTVITCFTAKGITLEGFDIAHEGVGAGALIIQIQDLIGAPGGSDFVSRITLRNNILHDSFNNDILKINNGAGQITVEGNIFYNQSGSDEHIDINSVRDIIVQDNIFFNDFGGSGRSNGNDTSSYIVVKDSNANDDSNLGSHNISIRRNVFLNWEGSSGSNFVLIGEDGQAYYEAQNVLVENNLMLGNSGNVMRAAFGVKGSKDITFRNNTVVGDLPSLAYAMRLNREGSNLANVNIQFYNNIWSDPSGTMGAENSSRPNDFSDTPPADTTSFTLENNLYYNGAQPIPTNSSELVNFSDDSKQIVSNPGLPTHTGVVLPRWNPSSNTFQDGSLTIRAAFEKLVTSYAALSTGSPALDGANASQAPAEDILGNSRAAADIGAFELVGDDLAPAPPKDVRPIAGIN